MLYSFANILSSLISKYFSPFISISSGEYFVKYTISPTFILSISINFHSGFFLPSHIAITSHFQGFSFEVGAVIIQDALFASSFDCLTNT
jgi:hypothetical protein